VRDTQCLMRMPGNAINCILSVVFPLNFNFLDSTTSNLVALMLYNITAISYFLQTMH